MEIHKTYPSDFTDKEWDLLKPLIPVYRRGRKRKVEMRDVLNGLLYITRTDYQWEYIPKDYPAKTTLFYYFRQWTIDGTWKKIHDVLRKQVRVQAGRDLEPTVAMVFLRNISAPTVSR